MNYRQPAKPWDDGIGEPLRDFDVYFDSEQWERPRNTTVARGLQRLSHFCRDIDHQGLRRHNGHDGKVEPELVPELCAYMRLIIKELETELDGGI